MDLRTNSVFFPCTALIGRFSYPRRSVFTARYELNSGLILYFIRVKGWCHMYKDINCWLPSKCIRNGIPVIMTVDKKGKKGKSKNIGLYNHSPHMHCITRTLRQTTRWNNLRQKTISALGSWWSENLHERKILRLAWRSTLYKIIFFLNKEN
jgi:hypothetical protein